MFRFFESLSIPYRPKAGQSVKPAPFQKQFVKGALADGVNDACLSIGRGKAKTALSAGMAIGAIIGDWFNSRRLLHPARKAQQKLYEQCNEFDKVALSEVVSFREN